LIDGDQPALLPLSVCQLESERAGRLVEQRLVSASSETLEEIGRCVRHRGSLSVFFRLGDVGQLEPRQRYSRGLAEQSSQGDDRTQEERSNDEEVILLLAILLVIFTPIATPWSIVVIAIACLLEVIEIVFLRRWAGRLDRRTKRTTGAEAMIGEAAEVVQACHPKGTVELMG